MRSQQCVSHHIKRGADTHILEYWVGHIIDVVEDSSQHEALL
jgi:hypothetical protein